MKGPNLDIPPIEVLIRKPFLHDGDTSKEGFVEADAFGICAIPKRTLGFHVLTSEGFTYWRLPIHAFCWKEDAPQMEIDDLVLWDCFSPYPDVHRYARLEGMRVFVRTKRKTWEPGEYLFTIDWTHPESAILDTNYSQVPHEHKCHHIIKLDNGNFAAQPNNRLCWHDPSFIIDSYKDKLERGEEFDPPKVNTRTWRSEQYGKWKTENSNSFLYGVEEAQ